MKHFFNTLDKRKVFLLSFFMAFLCLLPFLIRDGFFFLYYGDYNMQQLPFYTLVHRAIRNGELFLNFTTDLGSSIYSSYSFYLLGSPFFWITIPFPEVSLPYLMPFLLMLKLGLSSVTAFHYLKRHTTDTRSACIGALLYTFSGFQTMNLVFNHFLDVAVFFPLYLVCLEQLAEEGKRLRFALCTALMAVINYYFFFGEVVFLILYTLVKYAFPLKKQLKVLITILLEGFTGVLLSGFFFLPSILAVSGNHRVSDVLSGSGLFFYPDWRLYASLLKNLFLPPDPIQVSSIFSTDQGMLASVSLFLPLFSASGVIAFFFCKTKQEPALKRAHFIKLLLILCGIFALIPVLNASFSAFNAAYYTRWFYMPVLIMSAATAITIENFDKRAFAVGTLTCAAMFLIILTLAGLSDHLSGNLGDALAVSNRTLLTSELFGLGICLLFLVYLVFIQRKKANLMYLNGMLISTILVCGILTYSQISQGYQLVGEWGRAQYRQQISLNKDELPQDGLFYRVETESDLVNYSMYWDVPSVSCFLSTVPGSIMDFYDFAGIKRNVSSQLPSDRPGIRSLLSVRCFIETDTQADSSHQLAIHENDNWLHMGAVFSSFMRQSEYDKLSAAEQDLVLLTALVVPDDADLPFSELSAKDFQAQLAKTTDSGYLSAQCEARNQTAADSFTYTDTQLDLTYQNGTGGLLFLSIPYSTGFQAYVDGAKTEIQRVDGGLMAVVLPVGATTVTLHYSEPGLIPGCLLTLLGAIFAVIQFLINRRHRKEAVR